MPAIQPARLKQQAALLAEHFDLPPAFIRSLHHLLDFYADRAQRPGQVGVPRPLIQAYHVRPPVLRQLIQELTPLAEAQLEQALLLVDALWEQPYLEFRLLAVSLLGKVPVEPPEPVLSRFRRWAMPALEERLLLALVDQGLARLRRENPQALIRQAELLLANEALDVQQLGLRIILPMVTENDFDYLPVFFRLIQPFIRVAPTRLKPDILDVLDALAQRSPGEAAYLLRQNLGQPGCPDTAWMTRQCMRVFPPQIQESLKEAVRNLG